MSTSSGVEECQYISGPISDAENPSLSNYKKANDAGVTTVYIAEEIGVWK
jgi:hypothetical protein